MVKFIFIILGILIIAAAAATLVCYYEAFYTPHQTQGDVFKIPNTGQYQPYRQTMARMIFDFSRVPYEKVETMSEDGLKLSGKFYRGNPGKSFVIGFHGYRSMAVHDYCGEGPHMIEKGYNLILIDQRGHEESEGHVVSFGILERQDCISWCDYVIKRFGPDTKIFLSGISMGAATVLMASELDLPVNVKGILADCGYSSPADIIKKVAKDRKLPVWLLYPFVKLGARIIGHFNLEECSAVDAVKKTRIPILIAHGEDDRFVPCKMGKQIYEANPEMIQFVTYPEAGHGISFLVEEQKYKYMTEDFLNVYGR